MFAAVGEASKYGYSFKSIDRIMRSSPTQAAVDADAKFCSSEIAMRATRSAVRKRAATNFLQIRS